MRLSQRLGLDRAAIKLGFVRGRMATMAGTARVPHVFGSDVLPGFIPATGTRRYTVAFVQGCVSDVLFGPTNIATVRVLAANGCDVVDSRRADLLWRAGIPFRRPGAGPHAGAAEHRRVSGHAARSTSSSTPPAAAPR